MSHVSSCFRLVLTRRLKMTYGELLPDLDAEADGAFDCAADAPDLLCAAAEPLCAAELGPGVVGRTSDRAGTLEAWAAEDPAGVEDAAADEGCGPNGLDSGAGTFELIRLLWVTRAGGAELAGADVMSGRADALVMAGVDAGAAADEEGGGLFDVGGLLVASGFDKSDGTMFELIKLLCVCTAAGEELAGGGGCEVGGGGAAEDGGGVDTGGGASEDGGGVDTGGGASEDGGDVDTGGGALDTGGGASEDGGGASEDGGGASEDGGGASEDGGGALDTGGGALDTGGGVEAGASEDGGGVEAAAAGVEAAATLGGASEAGVDAATAAGAN